MVVDKPAIDTCEYSVSIINHDGVEGDKSPGKSPVVSDSSTDAITADTDTSDSGATDSTYTDDTDSVSSAGGVTTVGVMEDEINITVDDIIYQEVSGKHVIYLGVDYAAAVGTPVHTVGDGVVDRIWRTREGGRQIRVKHNGTYSTAYLHLSAYAKGIKTGKSVKQGDVIAYVRISE